MGGLGEMQRRLKILLIASIIVVIFIISAKIFLKFTHTSEENNAGNQGQIAPDGLPYGIPVESMGGTIYSQDYWEDEYGHLEDLVCTDFEDVKPEYYSDIDFSSVTFPYSADLAKDFLAFVALDAVEYCRLPEEVILRYFETEQADLWLNLYQNGYSADGLENVTFEPAKAPVYQSIDIYVVAEMSKYRVTYSTMDQCYTRYFKKQEDGRFKEIRGGWS